MHVAPQAILPPRTTWELACSKQTGSTRGMLFLESTEQLHLQRTQGIDQATTARRLTGQRPWPRKPRRWRARRDWGTQQTL